MTQKWSRRVGSAAVFALVFFFAVTARAGSQGKEDSGLASILHYIHSDWDLLTRSMTQCQSIVDPKLPETAVLYLPAEFAEPDSVKKLQESCKVRVLHLPAVIHRPGELDVSAIQPHGLLFLPYSYVVPGGRFNEMYGWDSYFIVVGLLQDGRLDLARNMVENFFFEIENYGTVLNANRTYYLTRSQPPFLTSMILDVYRAEKSAGRGDREWLEHAYKIAARDYENWVRAPHLAGETGLSRYYDFGSGPAPESLQDEAGVYRKVAGYFMVHPDLAESYIVPQLKDDPKEGAGQIYGVKVCDAKAATNCDAAGAVQLSSDYYRGDRSMRESGFDISFRFRPFGAATHHFAPVCLNSLLFKTEKDLEQISQELGHDSDAARWRGRAEERRKRVNQYLWDSARGQFFDYNLQTSARSDYAYVTTFYPLWAGLASEEQAKAVAASAKVFDQPGGLVTSTHDTGGQWDYPYGWAPLQLLAVEGLHRYGYNEDANRIAYKFLSMVAQNYRREGTIREKYDVVTRSSEANVTAGYHINVVGFGWTNGVFLQFLHELPPAMIEKLGREQEAPAATQ